MKLTVAGIFATTVIGELGEHDNLSPIRPYVTKEAYDIWYGLWTLERKAEEAQCEKDSEAILSKMTPEAKEAAMKTFRIEEEPLMKKLLVNFNITPAERIKKGQDIVKMPRKQRKAAIIASKKMLVGKTAYLSYRGMKLIKKL